MRFLLCGVCFFLSTATAFAYEVVATEVRAPYEVVPLRGDLEEKQVLLGTLDNFPIMYEVMVEASITLSVQLAQRYQEVPLGLSLMIVRVDEVGGGVTEVARLSLLPTDWQKRKDSVLGMSFLESEVKQIEVRPGKYRLEVSTPDNRGSYALTVGEINSDSSYGEALKNARLVQKSFGYSAFKLLHSSFVYYPLGILAMLFLLLLTWKFRNKIVHGK